MLCPSGIYARNASWFNIQKSHNVILYINRIEEENHMIILMDADKDLDKFRHLVRKKEN